MQAGSFVDATRMDTPRRTGCAVVAPLYICYYMYESLLFQLNFSLFAPHTNRSTDADTATHEHTDIYVPLTMYM